MSCDNGGDHAPRQISRVCLLPNIGEVNQVIVLMEPVRYRSFEPFAEGDGRAMADPDVDH